MAYSIQQFESDVEAMKPRAFDTYILPPFLCYYAYKSKGMKKNARRMLFTAGIYMFYRNYSSYKAAITALRAKVTEGVPS